MGDFYSDNGVDELIYMFMAQQDLLENARRKREEKEAEEATLHFDNVIESTAEVVEEVVYVG